MKNLITWFKNTFPPKEFMLRSNTGMKYFRVGTFMQVILITLLVTSGSLVALFTYKMQFLQTVNYKQNLALKDLRKKYTKFTNSVINLRNELDLEESSFTDTDLNIEMQVKKVTKLLELLEFDLAAINENQNIENDHRLIDIKNKLKSIIEEKQNRENMIIELDGIIEKLQDDIDKIYRTSNDDFYIDADFSTIYYDKIEYDTIENKAFKTSSSNKKMTKNLSKTIEESTKALTELKMLNYSLAMKKEEGKFFYEINKKTKLSTISILDERILFLEKLFKKTRSVDIAKLKKVEFDKEIGGPLEPVGEDIEISNKIFEKSNKFEVYRKRFLSVPLSAPIKSYYITSGYGIRKDPYTKRKAFHKGIDLGAPWGSDIKVTAAGKVTFVGRYGSYGKSVFVDHGFGIQTRYAHLSKIFVDEGQQLVLGDVLGKIGNTGRSTGKHLHYEIKINKKARNPRPFLTMGKNVSKKF
ncbi:MAG: hypothetical protein CMP24_06325 [Rickettsiales bacterium]|nr:hypothetical protein [Rickettsiales bacterium]